ncbi:hypothetical protein Gpo141_00009873 [Globisporangium polare]
MAQIDLEFDLLDREGESSLDEHLDAVAKAALKRKRHRDIVARSRMRHKATLATMRAQEVALCEQLNRMLVGYDRQRAFVADEKEIDRAMVHRAHEAYVEQVAMHESIRCENENLQDRLDDLSKFTHTIELEHRRLALESQATEQSIVAERFSGGKTGREGVDQQQQQSRDDGKGYWVYFSGDEEPIYYEPLTVQSCEASMQVVYRRMIDLYQDFSLERIAIQERQCFGWKVQRPMQFMSTEEDRRLLRFQFSKTIRCVDDSMDAIVNRTWEAFHNPALFAKIYSTVVVTRVVQRVDDNMTVLIQNAPNPSGLTNVRYFNILARMQGLNEKRERVVALVKTIVNPTSINTTSRSETSVGDGQQPVSSSTWTQPNDIEWMKQGFSFLLLTEAHADASTGERLIKMHYGTHYECISEEQAQYLMIEVLGLAARWEQLVLPTLHLQF